MLRLLCVIVVLIAAIWFGLKEGYDSWSGVETTGQRIAAGTQLIYGLAAVASLWALLARARWAPFAFAGFTVAVTITGTLAPVVWGGSSWTSGLIGGLSALIIALLATWGGLVHLRSPGV
jgi:hypothetical protein